LRIWWRDLRKLCVERRKHLAALGKVVLGQGHSGLVEMGMTEEVAEAGGVAVEVVAADQEGVARATGTPAACSWQTKWE